VTPHPTCAPRPTRAPGTPGNDPPVTFNLPSAEVIAERWKSGGYCKERCGSFATIANPEAERAPSTTQLLDPAPSRIDPKSVFISRICAWIAPSADAAPVKSGGRGPTSAPAGGLEGLLKSVGESVNPFTGCAGRTYAPKRFVSAWAPPGPKVSAKSPYPVSFS